jgi:hypothetical protein
MWTEALIELNGLPGSAAKINQVPGRGSVNMPTPSITSQAELPLQKFCKHGDTKKSIKSFVSPCSIMVGKCVKLNDFSSSNPEEPHHRTSRNIW